MQADLVTELFFRNLANISTRAAAEACGGPEALREIWRVLFAARNSKHALFLIRHRLDRIERARTGLDHAEAEFLALLAGIEASLPTEQPEPATA